MDLLAVKFSEDLWLGSFYRSDTFWTTFLWPVQ